jgi:DNA-binding LacI/PurR family transcriptional regulator
MRKPTVNDIAKHLEISPSTVSRVLNGSPLVKQETRDRIEAAAVELGYRKRTIRRHGSRSIKVLALFLPRSADVYHRLFYDPAELLAGLDEGFGEVRTQISVNVNQPKPDLFSSKKSGNIDGCVFGFTTPSEDVRQLLRERAIPSVLLNRESRRMNYVSADHLSGMRRLLRRAESFRSGVRPCYISFTPAEPVAGQREQAFLEACCAEDIGCGTADMFRIDSVHQLDSAFVAKIRERYNSVFCFNDFVAVYLYQVLLLAGVLVPQQIGIAGYDDSPVRQLTPQKIDSVTLSPYHLGAVAGQWLHRVVIERSTESLQLRIPGDVVPGSTLGPIF